METTGWPAEQVMTAMKIPAADQPKYLKLLSPPIDKKHNILN